MARFRIGIDVGGTHTDMVVLETGADRSAGRWRIAKIPSTPDNPARAVLAGMQQFIDEGIAPADVEFFSHGTTATTNALLEMRGARIGVLINAGHRGILEVQSQARDGWPPFDHLFQKPEPLARPAFVREIVGRIDYAGGEIEALDEAAVREAARTLANAGAKSFAICFLFSFMNNKHEEAAAQIIREEVPGAFVSCSSQVLPRIREWPRYSTTLVNAYLGPVLAHYCGDMAAGLDALSVLTKQRFLMQSNGGVMPLLANAETHAVRTLLSGPAAGVSCASYLLGQRQGWRNLVTMDIGGTSCDIAFIEAGEPVEHSESVLDGRVIGVPSFDISTVAAGGGSIARIDDAGLLEVGPASAGADPGPACYGRGGNEPTVTDANILRGALNPDYFLGGKARLDPEAARTALDMRVGQSLGLDEIEAAIGVVRIVNARISDAIRVEAAKKGIDLTGHTLVPFGGAGPVHAAQVAEDLGIPRVLVPLNPGAFSALGLLCTDVRHDYMRSEMTDISSLDPNHAEQCFSSLETLANAEISGEGLAEMAITHHRQLDLRYTGQGYELRVSLEDFPRPLTQAALRDITERFHSQHDAAHGHAALDAGVEVVSYHLRSSVGMPKAQLDSALNQPETGDAKPLGQRQLALGAGRTLQADIWRRESLAPDWRTQGPAIIEQPDATTIVPDGWLVRCDNDSNLILERATS